MTNLAASEVVQGPMQSPAPPKKKRVRRQKLELAYLRELVGKLEQQMVQLKSRKDEELGQVVAVESGVNGPPIWKGIAERQHKERMRAEEKNQTLRASLEGQLKLASRLERLLKKRPRDEEVADRW